MIVFGLFLFLVSYPQTYIYGPVYSYDGVGKHAIGIFEALNQQAILIPEKSYNGQGRYDLHDLSPEAINSIKLNLPKTVHNTDTLICTMDLSRIREKDLKLFSKFKKTLKINFSVIESNELPTKFAEILNSYFDISIVPSKWLVAVYKKSGVTIPVIHINLPIKTDDLIPQTTINKEFNFFCSAGPWPRKNHILLIKAFKQAFPENKNVTLTLQIRFFKPRNSYCKKILEAIENDQRIKIIEHTVTRPEYVELLQQSRCMVQVSSAEGYSILPREAICLQKPCIISSNTAHLDLLHISSVIPVKQDHKLIQAINFGKQYLLEIENISAALQEAYYNYEYYSNEARKYNCSSIMADYRSLSNAYANLIKI